MGETDLAAVHSAAVLESALGYIKRGWHVFPLHTVWAGRCTCGKTNCSAPGKHPRLRDGFKGASRDEATVRDWLKRWPMSNIAIRTGDGLMVLDVDVDKGGDDSLAELMDNPEWAETVSVKTGGGGSHHYFAVPSAVPCSVSVVADGLDVRGDGGYVVAPPSRHKSGNHYEWEGCVEVEQGEGDVTEAPEWLLKLCQGAKKGGSAARRESGDPDPMLLNAFIGERRNVALSSLAGTMRRRGLSRESIEAALLVQNAQRCRPPLGDDEVKKIAWSISRYEPADPVLGQWIQDGKEGDKPEDDWKTGLVRTKKGKITGHPGNAVLILRNHPDWQGALAYDAFMSETLWVKQPPAIAAGYPRPSVGVMRDGHVLYVQQWLAHKFDGVKFARDGLWLAIDEVARHNEFHPVREWLEGLKWDGDCRLDKWLSSYLGAEQSEYTAEVGRAWLVSAVARIMRPGCQADHVLVLEGGQGAGKSSSMAILFGRDWFLDSLPDIRQKDALMVMRGKWGIEVAELDSFRGAAETRIKSFITQRWDEYRPSYARKVVRFPRQNVIVATTNEKSWLTDPTGGRRFWPVQVATEGRFVDRVALQRDREQLWAEALARYESGEVWWPDQRFARMFSVHQEERFDEDVWETVVKRWAGSRVKMRVEDVFTQALGIEMGRVTRSDQMRVGRILRRLGLEKRRLKSETGSGRETWYVKP